MCSWVLQSTDFYGVYIDGLVQERHNSSVLAMELRLSCANPSICDILCTEEAY